MADLNNLSEGSCCYRCFDFTLFRLVTFTFELWKIAGENHHNRGSSILMWDAFV